jgi:predicted nucleic acid-binding protein
MNGVFADTFYFLALLNPRDGAHSRALAHATTFQGEMVTTVWVLTELADAMCSPKNRMEFVATLRDLQASRHFRIFPPDISLFEEGVQLYGTRPDKDWPLTDCISFLVMAREGITEASTGDHHFEQAGYSALLK